MEGKQTIGSLSGEESSSVSDSSEADFSPCSSEEEESDNDLGLNPCIIKGIASDEEVITGIKRPSVDSGTSFIKNDEYFYPFEKEGI